MVTKRKEFTDRQKAEIFVLDRALCSMSGTSLWLLDFGAAPSMRDWVDHIVPAARGGSADIENGACMSWFHNYIKRDSTAMADAYLFHRGMPTENYYVVQGKLSPEIEAHLQRFSALHWSDWYFNRAVSHVLIGARQSRAKRKDGTELARGPEYWATAALNALDEWRLGSLETTSMAKRGLVPSRPSADQRLLLELAKATTSAATKRVLKALVPYVQDSADAITYAANAKSRSDVALVRGFLKSSDFVVPRVKKAVLHNLRVLSGA